MTQTLNTPAEFATALHERRITECLETIDTLDAKLENPERSRRIEGHSNETAETLEPDSNGERASRTTKNPPKSESALARHMRKCSICKHPDREAIEADFINWRSEDTICYEFSLSSRSSIYRHAAATGLLKRRRLNLRGVCERIIERAEEAPPSAAAILRALRIFAHITEDGEWLELPKRSIVTHVVVNQDSTGANDDATVAAASRRQPSAATGEPSVTSTHENSETPSSAYFSAEIANNFQKHKHLPQHFASKILIGTQNTSPGESTT